MDITELLYFLGVTVTLFLLTLLISEIMQWQEQRAKSNRGKLLQKIVSVNLPRVLKKLNIDLVSYFDRVPENNLEEALCLCEHCASKKVCEQILKTPHLDVNDLNFCPLMEHIGTLASYMGKKPSSIRPLSRSIH